MQDCVRLCRESRTLSAPLEFESTPHIEMSSFSNLSGLLQIQVNFYRPHVSCDLENDRYINFELTQTLNLQSTEGSSFSRETFEPCFLRPQEVQWYLSALLSSGVIQELSGLREQDFDYCAKELHEYNKIWEKDGSYRNQHPEWMLCVSTGKRGQGICPGCSSLYFTFGIQKIQKFCEPSHRQKKFR